MGGNATLDSDILLDDLVGLADDLRDDLHTDFGVRAFRVYTVLRTWDGGYVGEGTASEVETEITPQPRVLPYSTAGAMAGLAYKLEPCGLDEAGLVILKEVSLSYTQAELTGRPVVDGVEQSMADGQEWVIRIREAHGQEQSYKDFKIKGAPFPDRENDVGWELRLTRAEGG